MNINMKDTKNISMAQLSSFLKGTTDAIEFEVNRKGNKNKQHVYDWISNTLIKFSYFRLSKLGKGLVLSYIVKLTSLSKSHVKKLTKIKRVNKKLSVKDSSQNGYHLRYTNEDIFRLVETDKAHLKLSAKATKEILYREYHKYGKVEYENISKISSSHIYNVRKKNRVYISNTLIYTKTSPVNNSIGIRKKPNNQGIPGYFRIDSVHQGDEDKEKGVYHINLVDEVTQWEIVAAVEGISEQFLIPILKEMLNSVPYKVINFHSDNGSEYINYTVAKLLNKLNVTQTKSRSRRSNDNALVESKNASIIRKHMGRTFIARTNASIINIFYKEHLNIYINYHRPCYFSRDTIDKRGKIVKKYDTILTPYEKFKSLPDFEKYLNDGVTKESLEELCMRESDNECATKLQKAKQKLFEKF